MKYEELQKCRVPLYLRHQMGDTVRITAYNEVAFLYDTDTGSSFELIARLNEYTLIPETVEVKLYKYNYYDKARQETLKSFWTTQSFYEYFPNNNNFELRSTEIKTVEIEE